MTYYKQLHPWCIIRVSVNQHLVEQQESKECCSSVGDDDFHVVARFRKHNDAAAYLRMLQNSSKNIKFLIIFDLQGVREKVKS
ncbi:MAG: hypothetical protein HC903_14815 [Methylacidiphilales bacterium]|nr:hypothetical protein [Candidatus Methylacidiphilales bacterium]